MGRVSETATCTAQGFFHRPPTQQQAEESITEGQRRIVGQHELHPQRIGDMTVDQGLGDIAERGGCYDRRPATVEHDQENRIVECRRKIGGIHQLSPAPAIFKDQQTLARPTVAMAHEMDDRWATRGERPFEMAPRGWAHPGQNTGPI